MEKDDICEVTTVSCNRTGRAPEIREKCYLSCKNAEGDVRVIIKGEDTKAVQPGQMYTVKVSVPTWEGIVPD